MADTSREKLEALCKLAAEDPLMPVMVALGVIEVHVLSDNCWCTPVAVPIEHV